MKCCGLCAYHLPICEDCFICDNEDSEGYGLETQYDDYCEEFKERGETKMPHKNVSYSCCICGYRYRDFDEANKCEKSHKIPIKVDKPKYSVWDKGDYPLSVLIHFKDNTSVRYYRNEEMEE